MTSTFSLPIVTWARSYRRSEVRADVLAGGAVWALVVPQSVAYATLAGVPVQHGLYAMVAALAVYAVFGPSSRVIAGISATTVSLTPLVIASVTEVSGDEMVAYSAAVGLAVGIIFLAMGVLRMGWIANFLSAPVVAGFITGFGISLAIDQVPKMLGYSADADAAFRQLWSIIRNLDETNVATAAVGGTCLIILFVLRRYVPRVPGALLVVVLGVAVSDAFDLGSHGVELVGDIPSGLPQFGLPDIAWSLFPRLILASTTVTIVALSETVGAAEAVSRRHREPLDLNGEFIANGFANFASGLVGGLVVNGSLSKTAANETADGRTRMTSIVAAMLGVVTILYLTGFFADLPEAVLGAIVFQAATTLIDIPAIRRAAHIQRADLVASLGALVSTLAFGILTGMLVGVALSLLLLVRYTSRPGVRVLGRNRVSGEFQRLDHHPDNATFAHVPIVRIDGAVTFASAHPVVSAIRDVVETQGARALIIDLEAASLFDTTALQAMQELHEDLDAAGVELHLARLHRDDLNVLRRANAPFVELGDRIHPTIPDALQAVGALG